MTNVIMPFIVLLVVGLIFNYIPMNGTLKQIGNIVIGVAALIMLLKFLKIV